MCVIAALLYLVIKATSMDGEFQINGQWYCYPKGPMHDSMHAACAISAVQGLWFWFRGYTKWGLEIGNNFYDEIEEAPGSQSPKVSALKDKME